MFCTSLRTRCDTAPLLPILQASTIPKLKESRLGTHDLALPVPRAQISDATKSHHNNEADDSHAIQHYLYILLLSAASLEEEQRAATLERVHRLSTLISTPAPVIAFLLEAGPPFAERDKGFNAFMELQILLCAIPSHPQILPISSLEQLLPSLALYISTLTAFNPTQDKTEHKRHALSLLPYVTAAPAPLPEHETYVLGDLCHNLKEVAEMACTPDGQGVLKEYLGEQMVEDIQSFWEEEWICD